MKTYRFIAHMSNGQQLVVDIKTDSTPQQTIESEPVGRCLKAMAKVRPGEPETTVMMVVGNVMYWELYGEVENEGNSYTNATIRKYVQWDDVPGR